MQRNWNASAVMETRVFSILHRVLARRYFASFGAVSRPPAKTLSVAATICPARPEGAHLIDGHLDRSLPSTASPDRGGRKAWLSGWLVLRPQAATRTDRISRVAGSSCGAVLELRDRAAVQKGDKPPSGWHRASRDGIQSVLGSSLAPPRGRTKLRNYRDPRVISSDRRRATP